MMENPQQIVQLIKLFLLLAFTYFMKHVIGEMNTLSGDLVYSGNAKMVQTKQGYASVRPFLYFDAPSLLRPKPYFDQNCTSAYTSRPIRSPGLTKSTEKIDDMKIVEVKMSNSIELMRTPKQYLPIVHTKLLQIMMIILLRIIIFIITFMI